MGAKEFPSYHDLYITTPGIERTRLMNLPHGVSVQCCRTTGWEVWEISDKSQKLLGGEYNQKWLVLDVNGFVVVDSRCDVDGGMNGESEHG